MLPGPTRCTGADYVGIQCLGRRPSVPVYPVNLPRRIENV